MDPKIIESKILEKLPGAIVNVEDVRGDGEHFSAKVSWQLFQGKTLLEQHRIVHHALKGFIGEYIHKMTIQTFLPE